MKVTREKIHNEEYIKVILEDCLDVGFSIAIYLNPENGRCFGEEINLVGRYGIDKDSTKSYVNAYKLKDTVFKNVERIVYED